MAVTEAEGRGTAQSQISQCQGSRSGSRYRLRFGSPSRFCSRFRYQFGSRFTQERNTWLQSPVWSLTREHETPGTEARCFVPAWSLTHAQIHANQMTSDLNDLGFSESLDVLSRAPLDSVQMYYATMISVVLAGTTPPNAPVYL
ncbi:hypothetical protein INR49_031030 [Caranx melampygus]|nr:hypothetical protein INR49_031030 [Caranx melampygus]